MIDSLLHLDTELFVFLNQGLANRVFDFVMPIITNDWGLRVTIAIIVLAMLIFGKKRERIAALLALVAIAVADQASSHLLKPLVERVRPCHVIAGVHLLVNCSDGLSFPSSHAANSFAVATLFSLVFRKHLILLFSVAIVVSYSRIAVGVHYPLDVFCGAIVGTISGLLAFFLFDYISKLVAGKKEPA